MDWIKEDDRVLYNPIKDFYIAGTYGQALQLCWGSELYSEPLKSLIHFMDLKRKGEVPLEITEVIFCDWLVTQSNKSFTARLWRNALEEGSELAWLTYEMNCILKAANMLCEASKKLEARRAATASKQLCTRVQKGVTTIMADGSREPSSPSLLSPKQVVVELVPRVLMALWPHSKVHTYLALSDMALGMAAAIMKRISSPAEEAGDVLLQLCYSQDRCSEAVDAILSKTSELFLPEILAEALNTRCLKAITLLTDLMGGHVLDMFGMAPDASVETAKATEALMDGDFIGNPHNMDAPVIEAPTSVENAVISEVCSTITEAPVFEAPIIEAHIIEAPVVEAPIIEAHIIEAHVVEAPIIEAHIIEAHVVEAHFIEAHIIEAPITEAHIIEAHIIEAPVIEAHIIEAPVIEAHIIEAHVIEAHIIEAPIVEAPIIDQVLQPEVPISRAKRARRVLARIFRAMCCGCCRATHD